MRKLLLAASALALIAAAPAPPQITAAGLSADIKVLASDAFEGRGPGTEGERKTVAFLVERFKALGLQPAGDAKASGGGWTQAVTLNRFTQGPARLELTAGGHATMLKPNEDMVVGTRRTGQTHTALAHAPLVFVGYGVSAPERRWSDFKGVDLHGKVAVVLVNDPDFEAQPGEPVAGRFGGKAMTYYGRWTYKFEELARQGAAGVLIVHERPGAGYGWDVVRNSWSAPQFDIPRPAAERAPLEGWIQRPVAVELFKAAGLDFEAQKQAARRADFRPVELKGASLTADFHTDIAAVTSRNVLAKITGRTHPNEAVLYSAHWDHLGVGAPDKTGDRIYNGAADNASGTAGLLQLAAAFKAGRPPERSVVFAAWTAEEKGLLGSAFYAAHPTTPLATTVANLNMDMLPNFGATRDISITGQGKGEVEDMAVAAAATQGRRLTAEGHPEAGGYFRSDHFSLAQAGVPALDFHGGSDLANGGTARGQALGAAFTAEHYHQPSDQWRADTDYAGAVQDLDLLHTLGRRLADGREWPRWKPGAEFAAARDRTAAARR